MNMPFPVLSPRLLDSKWFNADCPCDEEAELTALEQANKKWLSSIGEQYMKRAPPGKAYPKPLDEQVDTEEEGNDDESDESGESQEEEEDEEEVEEFTRPPPTPPRFNYEDENSLDGSNNTIQSI